jgi:uncharacterized membrane protein (DUF2068 family)
MNQEQPKSDFVLRLIAIYKLATAALFLVAAVGVLHLMNRDVETWLKAVMDNSHVDPDNHLAKWCLRKAEKLTNERIESISAIGFFYATLFATEGLGLYFKKRWAEYLVVVVTASLLPLEGYELWHSITWPKVVLLAGNLAILSYLIYVIRRNEKQGA